MSKIISLIILLFTISSSGVYAQNGLHFDGVDDYVATNYLGISGNASRTVEAWVNAPTTSGQVVITDWGTVGTGARFTFALINGYLRVEVQGSGQTGNTLIGDNNWHHVAATYDNSQSSNKFKMYVDGVLEMSFDLATPVNTGSSVNMQIGMRVDGAKPFNGTIDEVRVWNYARTATQIANNMNTEFCSVPGSLKAYHKLNNGINSGTNTGIVTSIDNAANNHGTLMNFALIGPSSNWVAGTSLGLSAITNSQTLVGCSGYSVTVGSNTYNSTGVYTDTIFGGAVAGCDSVVITDLTIGNTSVTNSQTINECSGYSVTVGNNTYTTTGVYIDTLIGASFTGCDSIVVTDLTIAPAIDISTTTTTNIIAANQAGADYQWLDCANGNTPLVGENGQSFTALSSGSYAVEVTVGNCVDTSACESITIPNGIGEEAINMGKAYPNPTQGNILLEVEQMVTSIEVLDLKGKVLIKSINPTNDKVDLNLSQLEVGVYILRLRGGGSSQYIRIVRV